MNTHKKILIADDDDGIAKLYTIYLETKKYHVKRAQNGPETFELIQSFKPDILLLDIMIPGLSGLDVLKQIRSQAETKNLPVIIFTALSSEKEKNQAFELGAKDYIVKSQAVMSDVAHVIEANT